MGPLQATEAYCYRIPRMQNSHIYKIYDLTILSSIKQTNKSKQVLLIDIIMFEWLIIQFGRGGNSDDDDDPKDEEVEILK